jgi:hypothetical protein
MFFFFFFFLKKRVSNKALRIQFHIKDMHQGSTSDLCDLSLSNNEKKTCCSNIHCLAAGDFLPCKSSL